MAANIDLESLKTELDEYGFVTIPNVISSLDADLMAKRVVDIMSRQPDSGELDNHLPSLLEHVMDTDESDLFFSAVTIPVYLELARHAVGEGFQSAGEAMRWTKPRMGRPTAPRRRAGRHLCKVRPYRSRSVAGHKQSADAQQVLPRKWWHPLDAIQPSLAATTPKGRQV